MWYVELEFIQEWMLNQDQRTQAYLIEAFRLLESSGPALGRPLVDSIKGSKIRNLKELRPASTGSSEIRIFFVFDSERNAVMLLAGDKSKGTSRTKWNNWYRNAIQIAELRYEDYLNNKRKKDDE